MPADAGKSPDGASMRPMSGLHRGIGPLLVATTVFVVLFEWSGEGAFAWLAAATTTIAIALLVTLVRWSRRVFVLVGAVLEFGLLRFGFSRVSIQPPFSFSPARRNLNAPAMALPRW